MVLVAQISDLHIVPAGTLYHGRVDTADLARAAVAAINRLTPRPDAVIVTGDVIDTERAEDYALAREILGGLAMPFYPMPGNHDHAPAMRAAFADLPVSFGPQGRMSYAADIGPLRLVVLDSWVAKSGGGHLDAGQVAFLDQALAAAASRPAIVALHHPPFLTGIAGMDAVTLDNPDELAALVRRHGNVLRVLCGHCHRAIVTAFAGTIAMIVPGTAHQVMLSLEPGGPFGFTLEPPGFYLHRYDGAGDLVTHLAPIRPFDGPFPFG
jgi:3',5'-cyclic AMP phosphodiesterase CpdA